jgi:RNA polymerase sporulation-specific sigma factor
MRAERCTQEKTPWENGTQQETEHAQPAVEDTAQQAARNRIVSENLGLVHMALKRFAGRGYEMEDLFQIGCIGLLKAADRFDPALGYTFSTYAVPLIIGEIRRFLRDDGMLHISRRKKEQASKIAAVRERRKKEIGREPTLTELEKETGFSKAEIVETLEFYPVVESIHRPLTGQSDSGASKTATLMDQLPDVRCTETEIVNKIALEQVMACLKETERQLLFLRYMEGKSQSETGAALGMNQVAVSRMEKKILLQLRNEMNYNLNIRKKTEYKR